MWGSFRFRCGFTDIGAKVPMPSASPPGTLLGRSDMASTMVRKLVSELVVAADRFCKPILQALFDVVINDGLLAPKGG